MAVTQQKLDEVELLQSMYPEAIFPDNQDILECQENVMNNLRQPALRFVVKLSHLELAVCLPCSYPYDDPAEIRIVWTSLPSSAEAEVINLTKKVLNSTSNKPVMLEVLSNISDIIFNCEQQELLCPLKCTVAEDIKSRNWYYSHHIYSKEKRENIIRWCKELYLKGFVLPGKPGIICIEGNRDSCKTFNVRIRSLNWQMLKLQHEEPGLAEIELKFRNFEELIFKVHGKSKNHQDLSQFQAYLANLNLENIFKILFNI